MCAHAHSKETNKQSKREDIKNGWNLIRTYSGMLPETEIVFADQ